MELTNMEAILELYFEGSTTLEQEALLRQYFTGDDVAPQFAPYIPLFAGLEIARDEESKRELILPKESKSNRTWWLSIAASIVIVLGSGNYFFSQTSLSNEEKEALATFELAKESMQLLSSNFNKGTEGLTYLSQFTESKNKILK
jgi:hypothetical protein